MLCRRLAIRSSTPQMCNCTRIGKHNDNARNRDLSMLYATLLSLTSFWKYYGANSNSSSSSLAFPNQLLNTSLQHQSLGSVSLQQRIAKNCKELFLSTFFTSIWVFALFPSKIVRFSSDLYSINSISSINSSNLRCLFERLSFCLADSIQVVRDDPLLSIPRWPLEFLRPWCLQDFRVMLWLLSSLGCSWLDRCFHIDGAALLDYRLYLKQSLCCHSWLWIDLRDSVP